MDDILVLARIVLRDPLTLVVGAALAVLLAGVWLSLVRGRDWGVARTVAAVLSSGALGMALAIVLARGALSFRGSWYCLTNPGLGAGSAEEALNLVLYLPAAFFAVLATRRPLATSVLFLALVVVAECVQMWVGVGTCELGDMTRNAAGVVVGVLAASVLLLWPGRRRPQEEPQDCVGVGAAD